VPPIPEIDIGRAVNLLIRQHGLDAELMAAKRADLIACRPHGQRGGGRLHCDQPGERLFARRSGGR